MGLVVAVEGMECAGKSTVVATCAEQLSKRTTVAVAGEFSDSSLGDYLRHRLSRDRFLRDPDRPRTAWTQIFSVAADTAFSLEYTIDVLRLTHEIVLKDRYRESLVACQHTALADEYAIDDAEARRLLIQVARNLPDVADLVIWLEVPAEVRHERLLARGDYVIGDEVVLQRREAAYRELLSSSDWPRDHVVVDGAGEVAEVTARVMEVILSHL